MWDGTAKFPECTLTLSGARKRQSRDRAGTLRRWRIQKLG